MKKIKIQCPAKINLDLRVFPKDEKTGYHNIKSIMQTINLYDFITLEIKEGTGISISGTSDEIPYNENNLCYKAADIFLKKINKDYSKKKDVVLGSYSSIELPKSFYYHNRTCPIKDVFRIIHVANQITFDGRKGHKELIQLLKILTQKGYNVEVVFVGKDYQNGQGKLINYAKEHGMEKQVIFTGYLTQAQMREQMILADVAVLPTKAEGLPRVIIEAMAMGLPCITTNVSGNPELISSDFLVDYENVQEMSAKLIRLIENRHLYQSVSEENFEKSKKFSADLLNQKRRVFYSAIKQRVEKLY